jgi:F-type H+-transporting ATPase subunit epsilon
MATFPFELVSPERVLFSGNVNAVIVPASEGDMTVLANHAPFMSALRAGLVSVEVEGASAKRLYVEGGFCDVSTKGLTLLAEKAVPVEEINREALAADIKNLDDDIRDAKSDEARASLVEKRDSLKAMAMAISH